MDYQMVKMTELDEAASFNNDDQILLLRSNNDVNTINVKNLLLHSHTNKNILDKISINNNNELLIDGINISGVKIDDTNKTNKTTYSSNKIEAIKEELNNNIANIDLSDYYTKTETDNKYSLIAHNHSITDITNLQKSLDNKSAINHKHTIADITDYTAPDLSSYLPLSGGTMAGDIILSYNNAIKSKDNSDNSDTTQDLIKFGIYTTRSESTYATIVGHSDNPTISEGNLYERDHRVLNSNNFTDYCPSISDLNNYLSLAGGTLTGDIILSNSTAIKGNISGTAQDLIKFGIYGHLSESTLATMVGNSDNPTISLGKLYEKNYRVLNSNNFTDYCPSTSDLNNYLPLSGGTMTGNITMSSYGISFCSKGSPGIYFGNKQVLRSDATAATELSVTLGNIGSLTTTDITATNINGGTIKEELFLKQGIPISSTSAGGGNILIENTSSVNIGLSTKDLNLNCKNAYLGSSNILTSTNYGTYIKSNKSVFAAAIIGKALVYNNYGATSSDCCTFNNISVNSTYISQSNGLLTIKIAGWYRISGLFAFSGGSVVINIAMIRNDDPIIYASQQINSSSNNIINLNANCYFNANEKVYIVPYLYNNTTGISLSDTISSITIDKLTI